MKFGVSLTTISAFVATAALAATAGLLTSRRSADALPAPQLTIDDAVPPASRAAARVAVNSSLASGELPTHPLLAAVWQPGRSASVAHLQRLPTVDGAGPPRYASLAPRTPSLSVHSVPSMTREPDWHSPSAKSVDRLPPVAAEAAGLGQHADHGAEPTDPSCVPGATAESAWDGLYSVMVRSSTKTSAPEGDGMGEAGTAGSSSASLLPPAAATDELHPPPLAAASSEVQRRLPDVEPRSSLAATPSSVGPMPAAPAVGNRRAETPEPAAVAGTSPSAAKNRNKRVESPPPPPLFPQQQAALAPAVAVAHQDILQAASLARRGAVFSARQRLETALYEIAAAIDRQDGLAGRREALGNGLLALREALDFIPPAGVTPSEIEVPNIVGRHRSNVLDEADCGDVAADVALQRYCDYAEQQLSRAGAGLPIAADALYALGKLSMAQVDSSPSSRRSHLVAAMTYFRAALNVNNQHYLAANELAVLMVRDGQLAESVPYLRSSLAAHPTAETWHNLALVQQRLGDTQQAQRSFAEWQLALSRQGGRPQQLVTASNGTSVYWVDKTTFESASLGVQR